MHSCGKWQGDLAALFEAQAARTPDAIALVFADTKMSFVELDERANQLAHWLVERGAGPERVVALALPRSADFVVALLAVLKTGAAVLPIGGGQQEERIAFLILHELPDTTGKPVTSLNVAIDAANPAYVMYSSDSTGHPEGVVVEHRNVVNLFHHHTRTSERLRVAGTAAFTSDTSWEGLLLMFAGHELHLVDDDTGRDPEALSEYLRKHAIDLATLAPSVAKRLSTLPRILRLGGGYLDSDLVARLGNTTAINSYGPTETTVYTVDAPVKGSTLGLAIPNTEVYILDQKLRPVHDGMVGELYISGAQVARGYHRRPGLTAERFVANPFGGDRMFRTGDLARWNSDGHVEFAGRADDHVFRRATTKMSTLPKLFAAQVAATPQATAVVCDGEALSYVELDELANRLAHWLAARGAKPERVVAVGLPMSAELVVALLAVLKTGAAYLPVDLDLPAGRVAHLLDSATLLLEEMPDLAGCPATALDVDIDPTHPAYIVYTSGWPLGVEVPHHSIVSRLAWIRPLTTGATLVVVPPAPPARESRPPVRVVPRPRRLPMSFTQQRFLSRTDSAAHQIPIALRLSGELDFGALKAALADVVARHETLRTVYEDGEQVVLPPTVASLSIVDELDPRVRFDLTTDIPLRAQLKVDSPTEHVLLLVLHHIAADGWSVAPLLRDLSKAYRARLTGSAPDWPPLPVQYAHYTLWQRDLDLTAQAEYWTAQLAGLPAEIDLPRDRPRPAVASHRGGTVAFRIDADVEELAHQAHATTFMVLHAALAVLLTKLGAGSDIPIGTTVAGRVAALDDLVGCFANTLVLRTDTSGNPTFRDLLLRVRELDLSAHAHADLPFARLVELLDPQRPLFQVTLVQQNIGTACLDLPGLVVRREPLDEGTTEFDLSFQVSGDHGLLEYSTDLFDRTTAQAIADRFVRVLATVVADPDIRIADIDVRLAQARRVPTVVDLFRPHDRTALVSGALSFTAAELNRHANRLAHWLIAHGARPQRFVALSLPRSPELVIAILAVLKSGAAHVVLDPDHPFALDDVQPVLTLTKLPTVDGLCTDPLVDIDLAHPAYVRYSSGSKAVEHRDLVTLFHHTRRDERLRVASTAAFTSDSSWEGLLLMFAGHELHLIGEDTGRDPEALARYLRDHDIDLLTGHADDRIVKEIMR